MKKLTISTIALIFLLTCFFGFNSVNAQGYVGLDNPQVLQLGTNSALTENGLATPQYGPASAEELEKFMDEKIPELTAKYHIPAFIFSYVKGNKILFNKGYGTVKPETEMPLNAEKNVLIVGSVAKVFASTAIMQQVDKGKLRLDDDVNKHLDFEIKNNFNKKISIKNLLQHTAGFEDTFNGQAVKEKDKLYTLKDYVKNYVPKVVYSPGEITSYSNYGYNLLAYIVERTSGKEFDEYVKENIFAPLEMNQSAFIKNNLIEGLKNNFVHSYSYNYKTNTYKDQEYLGFWIAYPAGAMVTNTQELGNFMLMYLNGGIFKGKIVLSPESVRDVQKKAFSSHRDLTGQALGFTVEKIHGHLTLEKSGEALSSVGQIVLFPEYQQGFSYSYNRASSEFDLELRQAIADRFFPNITTKKKRFTMSQEDLKKFEGFYRYTRYNQSDFSKLMIMMSPRHNAYTKTNDDGTLSVGVLFLEDTIKYEPISKNSFQKVDNRDILEGSGMKLDLGERIAFRIDENGKSDYLFIPFEKVSMERISFWQYGMTSIVAIFFSAAMAVFLVVYWLFEKLIKMLWIKDVEAEMPRGQKVANWVGVGYALLIIAFMTIMMMKFNEELLYGIPLIMKLSMIVPLLSIPAFLALVYFAFQSWKKNYWKLPNRILYTLFALSVFIFMIFSWSYNLISWFPGLRD